MKNQALETIKQTNKPKKDPVKLVDMKNDLRLDEDFTADDKSIKLYISAATKFVEDHIKRSLIEQKWVKYWDAIPFSNTAASGWWDGYKEMPVSFASRQVEYLQLDRGPLISVDSVNWYDNENNANLIDPSNYYIDYESDKPRVIFNEEYVWPVEVRCYKAYEIKSTAGYGKNEDDVPADIQKAISLAVEKMYDGCEDSSCLSSVSKMLLESYVIRTIG